MCEYFQDDIRIILEQIIADNLKDNHIKQNGGRWIWGV